MPEESLVSYEGHHVGDAVYFNHPVESWVRGTLTRISRVMKKDGFTHVLYGCKALLSARYLPSLSDAPSTAEVYPLQEQNIHHIIESCVEPNADNTLNDLLELSYLHDATLLEQVRVRYYENLIYTHIGPITLALNPYDYTLPNYTEDNMPKYIMEGREVIERPSKNLPHAWTVAHYSYWRMCSDERNQSIIVSGESGAGKTETAKIIVKYIGFASTAQCGPHEKAGAKEITEKVNLTSPILEAFGNARTKKNDNSSRFGKFMKVFFTHSLNGGVMAGSLIKVYLLERSRIVTHGNGERGYHSFYQLLANNGDETKGRLLNQLQLTCAKDYRCTSIGEATIIEGVDDAKDFDDLVRAMQFVGMTEEELSAVWNTVGAVLHLLSLEFKAVTDDECCVNMMGKNMSLHVRMVKELLGLPDDTFFTELTTTTQITRGETIVRKLRQPQAVDLCEGIAKSLYESLFLWLVTRINDLITPPTKNVQKEMLWIGLLDIFGFENFSHGNSFEQLCINLANETLQNHYNSIIFDRDIEECHKEGIDTENIVFYDNQPCLDLICGLDFSSCGPGGSPKTTNKISILHFLDEESALAKGNDLSFREKMCDAYGGRLLDGKGGHPNFFRVKTDRSLFIIRHYAGDVTYNVDGFRAKNSDTTKETLKDAVRSSTIPLIASLLGNKNSESGSTLKSTVGCLFRNQLVQLMTEINGTHPHWIRCIKPHNFKKPRMLNGNEVMHQMRSAGVLETIKIRQNSFSVRLPFAEFLKAYKVLTRPLPPSVCAFVYSADIDFTKFRAPFSSTASDREIVAEILRRAGIDSSAQGQIGKTKVFLKMEASQYLSYIVRAAQKGFILALQAATRCVFSCRRVHLRFLLYQLRVITAAVCSVRSQVYIRHKELKQKETYLVTFFRGILLLQTDEVNQRPILETQESTTYMELLEREAEDRHMIVSALLERKLGQDAMEQTAIGAEESQFRNSFESIEIACRQCLFNTMKFLTKEADSRDEVELDEAIERKCIIEPAHGLLMTHVSKWFAHMAERQRLDIVEEEETNRLMITKLEATMFNTLCAIKALMFSEMSGRALLLLSESDAFNEWHQLWSSEWIEVKKRWLVRKSITDRRTLLLLQKMEVQARREVECAYNQCIAELLGSLVESEEWARRKEQECLALEKEERRLQEEEQLARIREQERLRKEAVREVAQRIWRNCLEEEELLKEIRRLETHSKSIIAARTQLTRDYMLSCRRKEISKGKLNPVVNGACAMRESEEYRHQRDTLSRSLATNQQLLLKAEAKLLEFRSKTGLHSVSRDTSSLVTLTSLPGTQKNVSAVTLKSKTVADEGSVNLIHRTNLMKGLDDGCGRESRMRIDSAAAYERLEAYRRERERKKRENLLTVITHSNVTPRRGAYNSVVSHLSKEPSIPPMDCCLQRNPFKHNWSPGPPDADGVYWVFTPSGERVPLSLTELCHSPDPNIPSSDECLHKSSPEPFIPCSDW